MMHSIAWRPPLKANPADVRQQEKQRPDLQEACREAMLELRAQQKVEDPQGAELSQ